MKLKLLIIFGFWGISAVGQTASRMAQDTSTKKVATWRRDSIRLKDPSLKGQYEYMLSRSKYNSEGYREIANYRITQLWQNTMDTLNKERLAIKNLKNKSIEQEKTINYLKTELDDKSHTLAEENNKSNQIGFIGFSMSKGAYQITVWSIIGILAIALLIVITRSAKNILTAREKTEAYQEISTEYQTYKSKAVEKERKLARELQDERNKLDELKNRN